MDVDFGSTQRKDNVTTGTSLLRYIQSRGLQTIGKRVTRKDLRRGMSELITALRDPRMVTGDQRRPNIEAGQRIGWEHRI